MIYDLLEVFNAKYEQKGDKLILDSYQLKNGVYIKIDADKKLQYFIKSSKKVKQDGKNQMQHYFKNLDGVAKDSEYDWFKQRDYYSNIIDTSKAFDAPKKSIHSNNYLTLFMKIEEFLKLDFLHLKEKLYKKVLSFKSFKSKNEKDILANFCGQIKPMSRKKDIVKKMRTIEGNLLSLQESLIDHNPKEYVRIFFDESQEVYNQESAIYFALKIYNKNEYSIKVKNDVYGLSNDNMGLNSKKPFYEHKTKKFTKPFMITPQEAMRSKMFFDWLALQPYKTDIFDNIFLNRYADNGKAIINDYEYLPIKIEKLQMPVFFKNYLQIKDQEDFEIGDLFVLENVVDEMFYNKQLRHNYFRDDLKVSSFVSKKLQQLIFETKYAMVNYFKKYDPKEFYQVIKKYDNDFVIEHLRQNRGLKASQSLNLKLSLLQSKGEKIMEIKSVQNNMIQKLENSDYNKLTSEEFFYLCGQVAKYLLSKSKAGKKDADMLEPFLRAKNVKKLKDEIKFTFFKYKHEIGLHQTKFNNAMSLITAYEGVEKIDTDSFLVGLLSQNLFYMKKES